MWYILKIYEFNHNKSYDVFLNRYLDLYFKLLLTKNYKTFKILVKAICEIIQGDSAILSEIKTSKAGFTFSVFVENAELEH